MAYRSAIGQSSYNEENARVRNPVYNLVLVSQDQTSIGFHRAFCALKRGMRIYRHAARREADMRFVSPGATSSRHGDARVEIRRIEGRAGDIMQAARGLFEHRGVGPTTVKRHCLGSRHHPRAFLLLLFRKARRRRRRFGRLRGGYRGKRCGLGRNASFWRYVGLAARMHRYAATNSV